MMTGPLHRQRLSGCLLPLWGRGEQGLHLQRDQIRDHSQANPYEKAACDGAA